MVQAMEPRAEMRDRLRNLRREVQYRIQGVRYDLGTWDGPMPTPHVVKRRILRSYARRYGATCLIETGTYWGDMLAAMAGTFQELYSIELSEELFTKARARFAGNPHIHLLHGNSGAHLKSVLDRCTGKALVWLDAHYSGDGTARGLLDSPVLEEIACVAEHRERGHVVLIDDARFFHGRDGYPTLEELSAFVSARMPAYDMEVAQDVIRLTPAGSNRG